MLSIIMYQIESILIVYVPQPSILKTNRDEK